MSKPAQQTANTCDNYTGAAVRGAHAPRRRPSPPPARHVALRAGLTNPGAESAKENRNEAPDPLSCPVRGVHGLGASVCLLNVKTTLGNGYLGSRIDEERSEMRYLV